MHYSMWPSSTRPLDELLATAHRAEQQGWFGLWYADHFMSDTPDGSPSDDSLLECWSVLSALAASVPRLQLGSLVSPSTVHHPAVLANQAATVDHISGGRLVLGIGAGWQVNEHRAYGIELPPPGQRVDRFAEFIEIVRSLLHNDRTTFSGASFTLIDAPCNPKPIQDPLPIMVGTASPRMMALAARFADVWNVWGTPERIAERSEVFRSLCDKVGRDPAEIRRSAQSLFFLADDAASAAAIARHAPDDRSVIGGVEQMIEACNAYAAAGIDELIIPDFTLGTDASQRRDSYDLFWNDVVPHVG